MDKLPKEIVNYILHFLEPRRLDLARSVCTFWFTTINKRSFTLYCIRKGDVNALENVFSRYTVPFELIFKKISPTDVTLLQCLARLTNLTSISLRASINQSWMALTTLSKLKQLKLEDPPLDFIEKLPQLNQLHLIRACHFTKDLHIFSVLTALQDLKITFMDQQDYSGLLSALPNPSLLTRLKFNGSNMSDYGAIERFCNVRHLTLDYWSTIFENEEPFPLKFSALESLTVNGTNVSVEDITTNTTLTHLVLAGVHIASFENFSRLSKLQTLSLLSNSGTKEVLDEDLAFLSNLSALQNLTLDEGTGKFGAYLSPYLTSLNAQTCEMEWMRLENLRELSLTVRSLEHDDDEKLLLNLAKTSKLTRLELKVHSLSTEIAQKLPTTLRELDLFTATTCVIEIDFTRLKELDMVSFNFATNWWQPELVVLTALQQLTYLKLPENTHTAQAILPLLTNLRELNISPLSDNTIRQLTTLNHLTYVMCMRLESEGYALTCLTSLKQIMAVPNLKNSKETKATVSNNIAKALPYLTDIFLS